MCGPRVGVPPPGSYAVNVRLSEAGTYGSRKSDKPLGKDPLGTQTFSIESL